jgi:hypothetical protein
VKSSGQMKLSQHRTLFFVVGLHAVQNVVEDSHRVNLKLTRMRY